VVPPASDDYKRITTTFLFNGLQDQPSGGGSYWSIAVFYVTGEGRATLTCASEDTGSA